MFPDDSTCLADENGIQGRPGPKLEDIPAHEQYVVDVLLYCSKGSTVPKDRNTTTPTPGGVQPCLSGKGGEPLVVPVLLSTIESISRLRLFMPKDLRPLEQRNTTWKSVLEVQSRFPDGIPLLDPIVDMKITDDKFKELVQVCLICVVQLE